jgi:putative nucleotidyltransferase with HDIG domain
MNNVFFLAKLHHSVDRIQARSVLYVLTLWTVVAGVTAGLLVNAPSPGNAYVVGLLAVVAVIAERGRVELNPNLSVSISLVPTLFAAVLFGPIASMIVAAASLVSDLRRPFLRWASYTASRMLTASITGVVAVRVSDSLTNHLAAVVFATTCGACVSQCLDSVFAALALKLRHAERVLSTLRTLMPLALAAVPLYAPVVAFLALAYEDVSPFTLPLFFVPTLAAQRLYVLYQDQRRLTSQLVLANDALERANLSFASALVATLDARDRYTAGHSAAVAVYAQDIAGQMGLSDAEQQRVHLCGLVHDIGKIGLSASLLEKPGALTLSERREMERHSEIGERILANVDTYSEIASIVRHHHERLDGCGYPDGLSGEEIPLLSRIIAVADAYNAMTSDRPYRDAMPVETAVARLVQSAGSQFDPRIVAAFEEVLRRAPEEYREGAFAAHPIAWRRLRRHWRPAPPELATAAS